VIRGALRSLRRRVALLCNAPRDCQRVQEFRSIQVPFHRTLSPIDSEIDAVAVAEYFARSTEGPSVMNDLDCSCGTCSSRDIRTGDSDWFMRTWLRFFFHEAILSHIVTSPDWHECDSACTRPFLTTNSCGAPGHLFRMTSATQRCKSCINDALHRISQAFT
jgi:hypothetical protein